jgi:hypothetical protein
MENASADAGENAPVKKESFMEKVLLWSVKTYAPFDECEDPYYYRSMVNVLDPRMDLFSKETLRHRVSSLYLIPFQVRIEFDSSIPGSQ